ITHQPAALESNISDHYSRYTQAYRAIPALRSDRNLRLIIDRLSKAYAFLWALRDLSVALESGDLVALLGPNGAGKTTLLKVLAGLIAPTTGSICFDGNPQKTSVPRARTGLLMPADHLYDNLTVRENLRFFLSLYRQPSNSHIIDSALKDVALF